MGPIYKVEMTLHIRRRNGVGYSKKVETLIELNKLRTLGNINSSKNLDAVNLLFGNQFIGEEILSFYGYKETDTIFEQNRLKKEAEQKKADDERLKKKNEDEQKNIEKKKREERKNNRITKEDFEIDETEIDDFSIPHKNFDASTLDTKKTNVVPNVTSKNIDVESNLKLLQLDIEKRKLKLEEAKNFYASGGNRFVYYLMLLWAYLNTTKRKVIFIIILWFVLASLYSLFEKAFLK